MESRSGKSEVRWTYKQLYRVHLWPHLNKSSHSETALSNITFSLYSFLLCHITLWQRLSLSQCLLLFFLILSRSLSSLLPSSLSPSPFSRPLTIEPFMWPHFETWRGRLEGARGDTEGGGGGERRRPWVEEMERRGGRRGMWALQSFLLWSSFMRAETSFSQPKRHPATTPESSWEDSSVSLPDPSLPTPPTSHTSCFPFSRSSLSHSLPLL